MIKEYNWYITTNRFSDMVEQLNGAIREYGSSIGDNQFGNPELREKARLLCEEQLVKSGLRSKGNSFINIDIEFFNDGNLNEDNLNKFLKDIVKNHTYQKILWEYMGTTGLMTNVSKDKMKLDHFNYENYLPIELRKNEIIKNKNSITRDFHKLKDESGFDWKVKYDPNYSVKKNGWYADFDEDDVWTYFKTSEKLNSIENENKKNQFEIKLFKTDDGCMLYDSGNILLNPVFMWYLTHDGEIYGGEKTDTVKIVEELHKQMEYLGVQKITEISSPLDNVKAVDDFKELLGSLASDQLKVVDVAVGKKLDEENIENQKIEIKRNESSKFQHKIDSLLNAKPNATLQEISTALETGKAEVPLNSFTKDDCLKAGITEKEFSLICDLASGLGKKNKQKFADACLILSSKWEEYSSCGKSKEECISLVHSYYKDKQDSDFSYVVSLKNLVSKKTESVADKYASLLADKASFANALLEYVDVLPSENQSYAKEYIESIPVQKEENKIDVLNCLINAIKNYEAIRSSTGISLKELFDYAIKSANGSLPRNSIVPPTIGYITPNSSNVQKDSLGMKSVYFDGKVSELCAALANDVLPQKEVLLSELEKTYDVNTKEKPVVVLGRRGAGKSESAVLFDEDSINPLILPLLKKLLENLEGDNEYVNCSKESVREKIFKIAQKNGSVEGFAREVRNCVDIKFDLNMKDDRDLYSAFVPSVGKGLLEDYSLGLANRSFDSFDHGNALSKTMASVRPVYSEYVIDGKKGDGQIPEGHRVMSSKPAGSRGVEAVEPVMYRSESAATGGVLGVSGIDPRIACAQGFTLQQKKEVTSILKAMNKADVDEMVHFLGDDWSNISPLVLKEYLWRRENGMNVDTVSNDVAEIVASVGRENPVVSVTGESSISAVDSEGDSSGLSPILKEYIRRVRENKAASQGGVGSADVNSSSVNSFSYLNFDSGLSFFEGNQYAIRNSGVADVSLPGRSHAPASRDSVFISIPSARNQHVSVDVPFSMEGYEMDSNFGNGMTLNMEAATPTKGGNSNLHNERKRTVNSPVEQFSSPEAAKLSRMNANYEHDKAVLAKSDPVFAKNQFWDVGHADGSEDVSDRDIGKIVKTKLNEEITSLQNVRE